VIATGAPKRLHFGVTNEMAWEVGLACGGEIDIFVERVE
jgi:xanthine/CO dehydrogenase XdhC/CoxF family maturation factor